MAWQAGHAKGKDNDHNIRVINPVTGKLVGPHEWNDGNTDKCHFFSKHHNGKVTLMPRPNHAGKRVLPAALAAPGLIPRNPIWSSPWELFGHVR